MTDRIHGYVGTWRVERDELYRIKRGPSGELVACNAFPGASFQPPSAAWVAMKGVKISDDPTLDLATAQRLARS